MLLLALLSSALVPTAQAHVPHDVVEDIAAPPALDDSAPWWALLDVPGGAMLVRSEDAGHTWAIQAADPIADELDYLTWTNGTIVAASPTAMWRSSDDGDSWTRLTMEAAGLGDREIVAIEGFDTTTFIGTTAGIYTLGDSSLSAVVPNIDVLQLTSSVHGVVATDNDGEVWLYTAEDGWRNVTIPVNGASTGVAVDLGTSIGILAGNDRGELRVWEEGSWSVCTPLGTSYTVPDIVRLGVSGDLWLAANGTKGPFVSTDRCKTWQAHDALDVIYSSDGGAENKWQAYTTLMATDDRWVFAGWGGLAISEDAGGTWFQPGMVPVSFIRGLEIAPDFKDSGRLWVGAYAAGVIVTDAFEETFDAPNHGLTSRNVQSIAVDPGNSDKVFTVTGHEYAASEDGGVNWLNVEAVGSAASVFAFTAPTEVWVVGTTYTGGVILSEDGLTEWTEPEGLSAALGASTADAVVRASSDDGRLTCVSAVDPAVLLCRLGDDGSWEERFDEDSDKVTRLIAYPPGGSESWVLADETGIWRSTDLGDSWSQVYASDADRVRLMRQAGDGTIVALTVSGHVLRSHNGGSTWAATSVQLPGGPRAAVMRPNFTEHDQMLVGTPDGVWIVDDISTGPNLRRFGGYEGLDSEIGFFRCRDCDGALSIVELAVDYDDAKGDTVAWLSTDMIAGAHLRGERIRLYGVLPVGAELEVVLRDASTFDQLERAVITGASEDVIELGDWTDLPGGWVDVEITVTAGEAGLDFIEAFTTVAHIDAEDGGTDSGTADGGTGDGGTADGGTTDGGTADGGGDGGDGGGSDTGAEDPDKCGCSATPVSAPLFALVFSLVSLRRRRA